MAAIQFIDPLNKRGVALEGLHSCLYAVLLREAGDPDGNVTTLVYLIRVACERLSNGQEAVSLSLCGLNSGNRVEFGRLFCAWTLRSLFCPLRVGFFRSYVPRPSPNLPAHSYLA